MRSDRQKFPIFFVRTAGPPERVSVAGFLRNPRETWPPATIHYAVAIVSTTCARNHGVLLARSSKLALVFYGIDSDRGLNANRAGFGETRLHSRRFTGQPCRSSLNWGLLRTWKMKTERIRF